MNDAQKRAYEWAINQSYPSVAAQYAKTLAELVEELTKAAPAKLQVEAEDLRAIALSASSLMFHPELDEHQAESYGVRLHRLRDRLAEFAAEEG